MQSFLFDLLNFLRYFEALFISFGWSVIGWFGGRAWLFEFVIVLISEASFGNLNLIVQKLDESLFQCGELINFDSKFVSISSNISFYEPHNIVLHIQEHIFLCVDKLFLNRTQIYEYLLWGLLVFCRSWLRLNPQIAWCDVSQEPHNIISIDRTGSH